MCFKILFSNLFRKAAAASRVDTQATSTTSKVTISPTVDTQATSTTPKATISPTVDSQATPTTSQKSLYSKPVYPKTPHPIKTRTTLTFPLFPKLPPELRQLIWKHASFQNRNIDIRPRQYKDHKYGLNSTHSFRYITFTKPPAILHANKKAREIGLKYYKLHFGRSVVNVKGNHFEIPPRIYANLESDTICPNWCIGEDIPYRQQRVAEKEICGYVGIQSIALNVRGQCWTMQPAPGKLLENGCFREILFYYTQAKIKEGTVIRFINYDRKTRQEMIFNHLRHEVKVRFIGDRTKLDVSNKGVEKERTMEYINGSRPKLRLVRGTWYDEWWRTFT